ncbi:MAG: rod shape-determining protein MreD [Nocardioidaceae bacterium]|nr:rod shape-determining protein MreD [Nocardioidaceae bacterium]
MGLLRSSAVGVLLVVTVTVQVGLFTHLSIAGVVPDLALLVVVAAALVRGPVYGTVLGLVAGLLVDLAPPADGVAGRWALALAVAGWLAGLARGEARQSAVATVVTVAVSSFAATSLYAMSGLVLRDPGVTVGRVIEVLPVAVLYDVAVTPLVVPLAVLAFRRLDPAPIRW